MQVTGDRLAGAGLLVLGALLLWLALAVDRGLGLAGLTPRSLPIGLAVTVGAVGLVLLLRGGGAAPGALAAAFAPRVLGFAALLALYYLVFPLVDFRLGAWLFMLAAMLWLGARRPLQLVLVPLGVSLGVYLAFRHGFGVFLPVWG